MGLPTCFVIDPLNCFITRDIVGAHCVRPFSSVLIEMMKWIWSGMIQYLSTRTASYTVFSFLISLSTIIPISDNGGLAGEHSSPLRSDQKIFSLFAVQTVMKYAPGWNNRNLQCEWLCVLEAHSYAYLRIDSTNIQRLPIIPAENIIAKK